MTPTVLRVETRFVDPPHSRGTLDAVRDARRAVVACGHWPQVATVEQYRASVARAERALDHLLALWDRWCRRHGHHDAAIDRGPLAIRFCVTREFVLQRCECVRLLVDEIPVGSA